MTRINSCFIRGRCGGLGGHCYDSGNWIGDSCHGWAMASNRSKYRPAELPPISRTLGKTSRIKREHAGLNREDFAKLAGLSTSGLHRVEDMETMPSVLTQEKICAGFGIPLMELIAETDRRSRA